MATTTPTGKTAAAELKQLREARKQQIAAATARMKAQRQAVQALKAALRQGDQTVPELARATRLPTAQVLYYLATMKKYGQVVEGEAAGSYFRYRLAEPASAAAAAPAAAPTPQAAEA